MTANKTHYHNKKTKLKNDFLSNYGANYIIFFLGTRYSPSCTICAAFQPYPTYIGENIAWFMNEKVSKKNDTLKHIYLSNYITKYTNSFLGTYLSPSYPIRTIFEQNPTYIGEMAWWFINE